MRAIFLKEFYRLWIFLLFLSLCFVIFFTWFGFDFLHKFNGIHPESVIWYQYVFLENEPERVTLYVMIFAAVSFALAQFLTQKNRIKCLLHLPLSHFKILIWHYAFGLMFFTFVWLLGGIFLLLFFSKFYPDVIYASVLVNWSCYSLLSAVTYIMTASVLTDSYNKRQLVSGILLVGIMSVFIFYVDSFFLLLVMFFLSFVLGYNSLISHKQININSYILSGVYAFMFAVFLFGSYQFYEKNFSNRVEKYYIFYSPTLKEFIYQQNLGGHHFAYKTAGGGVFENDIAYKNELAFNYYMDLKQQNKLPVTIDAEVYDERIIRDSRASITLNSKDISTVKIPLYPLFNPNPNISAIPFSSDMLYISGDKFLVYHHDGNVDTKFSDNVNLNADKLGLKFPISAVFGRFNNLKPFDAGLFLKDAKGEFFNIRVYDNKLNFIKVETLNGIDYLHISESKNSDMLGLAFKQNDMYIFNKDYTLTNLNVDGFDFSDFRLRVSFDPKYLQVRFDNGEEYNVFAFDRKTLKRVDKFSIK